MYGYFEIPTAPVDTDDDYTCTAFQCSARVLFCSPAELRSLDTKAQAQTRLCTQCWYARNPKLKEIK